MLQLVPRLLVMLCCNQIVPRGRKKILNLTVDGISADKLGVKDKVSEQKEICCKL
ncbi:hypothetical protein ES332_A03G237000v1 [Gossypium tomentosum]|uniref:Uncharacterized protein n=1 Tax=Gossypium tomentosum TaxID=34277 RepID=A0A5D2RBX4_GOSTO|nr:hypothetical protein ES332_A03G237000v1 [Gossypium tomentosum]